jgi:nucleoside-diphosphate-sugar epimerase
VSDTLRHGIVGTPDRYAGVRTLVLGGAGFIGRWVTHALASAGAVTHVVTRDAARARRVLAAFPGAAEIIAADLSQPGTVADLVRTVEPAVVFNLAAHGVDPSERSAEVMARLNTAVVAELCDALRASPECGWRGVRLVHAGSALEYGSARGALAEDVTPVPTTAYGRSKLEATRRIARAVEADGLAAVAVRLFTVYGPGEHAGRLLPSLIEAARTRTRVPLSSGRQRRDFTYVEDVAEGLLRIGAAVPAPGAVLNLATGRLTSVREFAETAADVLSLDRSALEFEALPTRSEEMWHDEVDVTRLRRLVNWAPPTTVTDGIRRTWEWIHAQR